MKEYKFWTINCSLLEDDEFEVFVEDIERYIDTLDNDWALPQKDSESWLSRFAINYEEWSGRQFKDNRFPISNYFMIDKRYIRDNDYK